MSREDRDAVYSTMGARFGVTGTGMRRVVLTVRAVVASAVALAVLSMFLPAAIVTVVSWLVLAGLLLLWADYLRGRRGAR